MAQVKGLADDNYTGNLSMQKYSIACRKELNKLTVHQIITKHEVYLGIWATLVTCDPLYKN